MAQKTGQNDLLLFGMTLIQKNLYNNFNTFFLLICISVFDLILEDRYKSIPLDCTDMFVERTNNYIYWYL